LLHALIQQETATWFCLERFNISPILSGLLLALRMLTAQIICSTVDCQRGVRQSCLSDDLVANSSLLLAASDLVTAVLYDVLRQLLHSSAA
jgi:hypothetical protein